jgi:glycosyltransferase involved in cell wall biosynthesis
MAPTLSLFCLEWHLRTSPAQQKTLILPLAGRVKFRPIPWDGETFPSLSARQIRQAPLVFYSLPPPQQLLEDPQARLVWIPMWDEARGYPPAWWQSLPKNLRVVAFSNTVRISAQAAGLQTLFLKYFEDANPYPEPAFGPERVLLYWNRTSLVGPAFLNKFCSALRIDRLLFRANSDPGIRAPQKYSLPARLGKTEVEVFAGDAMLSPAEYHRLLCRANIFLAPRSSEGVGLSFLDAMARGCAVFGFNAATMNEYILQRINGYLLPEFFPSTPSFLRQRIDRKVSDLLSRGGKAHTISPWQDWDEISRVDLPALGAAARQDQRIGFESWRRSIPEYARFLTDW